MEMNEIIGSRKVQFLALLVIFAIIIYLTIIYRTTMLSAMGFYEPDGFYHFSVIRAAISNGFTVPHVLHISGYPNPTSVQEPQGLYWVTLFPYLFLQFFGVSYYNLMRLIPVLFGILDVIGAYLLARMISKDKLFGILSALFVALSMGDAARTSALIYRGDGFVTIFLIMALIFAALVLKEETKEKHKHRIAGVQFDKKKAAYAVLSAVFLSACNYVWNGAPFATAVYMVMLMLVIMLSFIFQKKEMLEDSKYLVSALVLWYVLVNVYKYYGAFVQQTFTGLNMLSLLALSIIAWFIAKYLSDNAHRYKLLMSDSIKRVVVALAVFAAAIVAIYFVDNQFLYSIFVGNGFIITSNFAATIQELQPPTQAFLYASFGNTLFITPMSIVMYLGAASAAISKALVWILMLLLMIPYLFMQVFDSGGFMKGKAKAAFGINPGMLVLMAYFAVTAYLQINAIRFNSLISIPLALFAAYTVYWFISFAKSSTKKQFEYFMLVVEALLIAAFTLAIAQSAYMYSFLAVFGYYQTILLFGLLTVAYPSYLYISSRNHDKHETHARYATFIVTGIMILAFIAALMSADGVYANNLSQADNVNPQFLSAMSWMKNNTPVNSVALTLWPDGSVVEGWANRTSVTDSVGSQNGSKADPFAAWLFNSSSDPQFLTSKINGKPDYLLARYTWMVETQGIYTESNLTLNSSLYGSVLLNQFGENFSATTEAFQFANPQGIHASVYLPRNGSTTDLKAYIIYGTSSTGQEEISPFSTVVFYNQNNANFSAVNPTYYNKTSGNMLVMMYSQVPRQGFPVNITGAYILSSYLAATNIAKFLFLCSSQECAWNNRNTSLQLVYSNQDSKLFKIIYNTTSQNPPTNSTSTIRVITNTTNRTSIKSTNVTSKIVSNSIPNNPSNSLTANQINASANKTINSSSFH